MKKAENKNRGKIEGKISISSKGTGYVSVVGFKEDIEVDYRHLNRALHGDIVEVIPHPKKNSRAGGEVSRIVTRAKDKFSGILMKEDGIFFLKPDDTKMYVDILIPEKNAKGAKPGQKIFVEISSWTDPRKMPEGKILKVFGQAGENDAEMHAIATERGFDEKLKEKTEAEAKKIKELGIRESDYKDRRDFRKTLTFTIDPEDAKDFDDAISFKELESGRYEIGIHIADVSHYVKTGSDIDEEAEERGTSVYLVDRTIPMLPEVLSNDLCSLVPHKDRLTMSAVFVMDKNAEIEEEWYGRTVIHSQKRFTYEEAEDAIKNKNAKLHPVLHTLNQVAKKLNKDRFEAGAISLEQEEVKFVLNAHGEPIKVIKKIRGDSNKLIEEFMLLANRKVAEKLSVDQKNKNIFVYRVHDLPSLEKTGDLVYFLKSLGHKVHLKNNIIPASEINRILRSLEGKAELDAVSRAIIRSQAKAVYSTENIGHFGLGFAHYTHFTSPIRRYPDIVVHRILNDFLQGKKISAEKLHIYEKISRNSSEQEKRASDAERASIKYKQVEYMSKHIGETFKGVISGVTEWGIYVEEIETKCEGLVRVRDMTDDYYVFDEKKMELVGEKKKKRYHLGGHVKIQVKRVDLERKNIDYILT